MIHADIACVLANGWLGVCITKGTHRVGLQLVGVFPHFCRPEELAEWPRLSTGPMTNGPGRLSPGRFVPVTINIDNAFS